MRYSGTQATGTAVPSSPHPNDIRKALERILASPDFANAVQLKNFLRFVVEGSLDGRAKNIKQYRES